MKKFFEALLDQSATISTGVSSMTDYMYLFKSQAVNNVGNNRSVSGNPTKKRSRDKDRDRSKSTSRSSTSQDVTSSPFKRFFARTKDNPKHLLQMTPESFNLMQKESDNAYEMLEVEAEESFLNAFSTAYDKFADVTKSTHGEPSTTKRACIWKVYNGTCTRENCPYEHDDNKLRAEKKIIVERLTRELSKLPPERLRVVPERLHNMQKQSDYNDDSVSDENEPNEDSDTESDTFLDFVFGDK